MGIVSAISKIAVKAISKVGGKTVRNIGRTVKAAPDFVLGTGMETASRAMTRSSGSIFTRAKSAAKAVVVQSEKATAKEGGFFTRLFKNIKNTPKDINHWRKVGIRSAKLSGKNSFVGGAKGVLKGLAKKMPMINSLLMIGFEIPNIWKASTEEGVGTGLKETGKAAVRLTGGASGAVLGTFLGGPIGGLLGFMAGEWLTGKVIGDSYSEKKEFLEANGIKDEHIATLKAQGYSFDDIYDLVKAQIEAAEAQQKVAETQSEISGQQPMVRQDEQQPEQVQQGDATQPEQAQQPVQQQQGQVAEQQPILVDGQQQGAYSQESVGILHELGATDSDIAALQQAGVPIYEAIRLIVNLKSQNQNAPVGNGTTIPNQTTFTPQISYTPTEIGQVGINLNTPAFEPFQLPYDDTFYANPYANDIYHKSLFGSTTPSVGNAEQKAYSINPNQKQQKFFKYV